MEPMQLFAPHRSRTQMLPWRSTSTDAIAPHGRPWEPSPNPQSPDTDWFGARDRSEEQADDYEGRREGGPDNDVAQNGTGPPLRHVIGVVD